MCRLIHHAVCRRAFFSVVASLLVPCWAMAAPTGIPWHPSLEQAKAAATISKRPVLVVFGASWSDASVALHEKTLSNSEAVAIVTACFEPVKIDVDVDPATTKKMGITYLPSACVIDHDDHVLASFDCPATPASFIAAAGKAVQDAAAARQQPVAANAAAPTGRLTSSSTATASPVPDQPLTAVATSVFPAYPAATEPVDNRPLSRFSSTEPVAHAANPASAFPAHAALPSAATAPAANTWPAESPDATLAPSMPRAASLAPWDPAPAASSPAATTAARPMIEPAPVQAPPSPAGTASWLGDTAQQTTPAPASPSTVQQPYALAPTPAPSPAAASAPAVATYGVTPPPPASANEAGAAPGNTDAEKPKSSNAFLAAIQRPFSFFSSTPKVEKAEPTTPPAVPNALKVDSYGTMPLGMEGYCPVTLAEKGQWVEGRAQWGARHRGRTYLFASEAQQRAFLANPDRYAPALSGDDPVVAFDAGKSVPGQRRYGVTYQSRIYLFSSPETRTTFSANPQRYTSRVAVAENPPSSADTILR